MTAIEYEKPSSEPALARVLHLGPRSGGWVGLGFWLAGWAALGLHVAHAAGLGGGLVFVTVECWLLLGSCLGLPVMALRVLGSQLTPQTCTVIGVALTTCVVVLTVLYSCGAFTPRPANAMAGLSLCGGMAMRCLNAADGLRAMQAARAEHRDDCVIAEAMTEHELAEALAPLAPQQRAQVLRVLTAALQRCSARNGLHVVDGGR